MTLTTVAVNGKPLETYGLQPIALERWLAPPEVTYTSTDLVGRIGAVPSTRGMKWSPRSLVVGVRTTGADLVTSRNQLGAWYAACQGMLEMEVVDAPGRVCYGLFEAGNDDVDGIRLLSPSLISVGRIVCYDPLWYDRSPVTVNAATATRVAIPCGTAPGIVSYMVIGGTNPTVTLRRRTGESLAQMRFTVTLGATEALEVDWRQARPITKWTAGVASDAFDTLNVEDTFVYADPLDAPTLETSSGTLLVTTWRGYLT